jgi:hypothetical protein
VPYRTNTERKFKADLAGGCESERRLEQIHAKYIHFKRSEKEDVDMPFMMRLLGAQLVELATFVSLKPVPW